MRIILNFGGRGGRLRELRAIAVAGLGAALVLGACSMPSSASGAKGRLRVVAAESFWGSLARQIAGPDADVTSLISNPDTDPHNYEPTPADARALASAGLVIENGIGYDPWAQQLLDAGDAAHRIVLNVGDLVGVPEGGNPHQWYARTAVLKVIDRIAKDLAAIDPQHRAGFAARARTLRSAGLARYDALSAGIRHTYAGVAIGGSESIVSVWASALGLRLVTPASFVEAVAEGNEPTASDKATVDSQIKRHEIKVFVFNRQNLTPDVQRLVEQARAARIPTVAVTETLVPEHATFQAWQVRELEALRAALEQAESR